MVDPATLQVTMNTEFILLFIALGIVLHYPLINFITTAGSPALKTRWLRSTVPSVENNLADIVRTARESEALLTLDPPARFCGLFVPICQCRLGLLHGILTLSRPCRMMPPHE